MRNLRISLILVILSLCIGGAAFAHEDQAGLPEKIPQEHWSCRDIVDLAHKYGAEVRIPPGEVVEKRELVASFVAVMQQVLDRTEKEGPSAVSEEDMERLATLHAALKPNLEGYEGYLKRREAIEAMLAKPETPEFFYKIGLNGFLRVDEADNFTMRDFSHVPGHSEGHYVYRVKPYAYWHPTDWIDIHAEGQGYGYREWGRQEFNRFSLYQGFAEIKTPGRDWLAVKGGRQEFSYGNTFILGADSFYDGLSFDAARLRIKPADQLSLDILFGSYARPFSGGTEGELAGAYLTYEISEGTGVEAYAFRDSGSTDRHAGEYLATWGLRGTAKLGPVSLEVEPVYESGQVYNPNTDANDRIDAYGGHVDVTVESLIAGFNNKFYLSWAIGSGSVASATEGASRREFRNPNNDTSLVGDIGLIGDLSGVDVNGHRASGMQIYTLGWGIDLTKELNFTATGRAFRAEAVEAGFHRNLGIESDFTLTYAVTDNLSLIAGYDRFFTGGFFSDASGSGKDIDYGYLMLQFDLSHMKPKLKKI